MPAYFVHRVLSRYSLRASVHIVCRRRLPTAVGRGGDGDDVPISLGGCGKPAGQHETLQTLYLF